MERCSIIRQANSIKIPGVSLAGGPHAQQRNQLARPAPVITTYLLLITYYYLLVVVIVVLLVVLYCIIIHHLTTEYLSTNSTQPSQLIQK